MKSSFGRSFSVFAGILLVALTVLGGSFQMMVQNYLTETSFTSLEQDAAIIQNLAACLDENSMSSREFLMNLDVAAKVSGSDAVICNTKGKVVICSDGTADCGHKGLYVNKDYLNKVIEQGGDRATGMIKGLYDDERFLVSSPITNEEGQNLGILIVSSPLAGVNAVLTKISNIFLTIAAFVVLASVAAVSVFARRESKPLQEMAKVANAFGHGNLEARVKIEESYSEEVEELALAFNNMASSLQKSEYRRQEFVANVSHELKTPITSIRVLADSLMSQEDVPVELYREFMGDISEEIDRESQIIEDLLTLVRMDKSSTELNVTQINVNDLLEATLKRLRPIAQQKNVELVLESFRPVLAELDKTKFTLAISNLVENAIKYNNQDGWVKVSLNADHKFFYVKVADNGIGIPEEAQEHVFERFYRVDKARSRAAGGTGLGLAITRSIVYSHHGAIKLYSRENEGTTFTVRIPLIYIA